MKSSLVWRAPNVYDIEPLLGVAGITALCLEKAIKPPDRSPHRRQLLFRPT